MVGWQYETDESGYASLKNGGRTIVPANAIHLGRFAVIADPQGAAFAVFEGETDP